MSTTPLLAPQFFFEFAVPCHACKTLWSAAGAELDEKYRVPSFSVLTDQPGAAAPDWAELRCGWNATGLALQVLVREKRQPPWCRASRCEDSDGVSVWIDTRNARGIHRANRYCHACRFLPAGAGRTLKDPHAEVLRVPRAKESPPPVDPQQLQIRSSLGVGGYQLDICIAADALNGFDPADHPRLGFSYLITDREMGELPMTVGSEFPIDSDPTLWSALELVR